RLSGGAPERPYDVAGWTLPMQMGVQVISVLGISEPESERRLTPVGDELQVRRDLSLFSVEKAAKPQYDPRFGAATLQYVYSIKNPVRAGVRLALYRSWT